MDQLLTDNQQELIGFPWARLPLTATSQGKEYKPGLEAIVKPSDGKILGVLPENQFVMDHLQAFAKVQESLRQANIACEISKFHLLRNGARMFIHFRMPDMKFDVGVDGKPDVLYPEVILRNGLDGKLNFGLEWGIWREICTNGARAIVLGDRATKKILMGDTDVEVMMTQIKDFFAKGLNGLREKILEMQKPLEPEKVTELQEKVADFIEPHFSNKLQERFNVLVTEETKNEPLTEWLVFNGITNIASHDVRSYNRRRDIELAAARKFGLQSFISSN